jgi:chemotaxis protein methyltransferase CheR
VAGPQTPLERLDLAAPPRPPVRLPERGPARRDAAHAPPSPSDEYAAAEKLYRQGQYAEAQVRLERLLAHRPTERRALELLARTYADQGQLADALQWADQAITAAKLDPGVHYLRATILQEQGKLAEAVQSLHRALYLDHDFVLAHFASGSLARKQGYTQLANKHFANALTLLDSCDSGAVLPESDGVTAGRLREIILAMKAGAP